MTARFRWVIIESALLTAPPPPIKENYLQIQRGMPAFVLLLFPPPLHFDADCCDMEEDAVPWVLSISYSLDPFGIFWMKVKPGRSAWEWCMIPELLCDLLTGAARSSCACWLCVLAGLQIVVKVKVLRALGKRRICLLYIHPGSPPLPVK